MSTRRRRWPIVVATLGLLGLTFALADGRGWFVVCGVLLSLLLGHHLLTLTQLSETHDDLDAALAWNRRLAVDLVDLRLHAAIREGEQS